MEQYNRLAEISYTIAIMQLTSFTNLTSEEAPQVLIDFLKKEWPKTKENYGLNTLTQLINIEITSLPKPKKAYSSLTSTDKIDFWKKVEYIESDL